MLRRLLFGRVLKEILELRSDFNVLLGKFAELVEINHSLLIGHSRLLILIRTNQFKDQEEIMATLLDVLAAEGRLEEAVKTQGESTLLVIELIKAEAQKIQDALQELADLHAAQGQVKPEDLALVKGKIDGAVSTMHQQTDALKQVLEQFSQPIEPAKPVVEPEPEPEPVIAVEEPLPVEEPVVEEPVVEEPVVEEPLPVVEEPVVEDPAPAKQPGAEDGLV